MNFLSYTDYLFENKTTNIISNKIETKYGWLDYYYEISDEYPNGVVVDLGGYIYKKYRKAGKFKQLFKKLLLSVPLGTTVQVAVANRKLLPMFKRLNFKKVSKIAYWGNVSHAMETVITPELINAI